MNSDLYEIIKCELKNINVINNNINIISDSSFNSRKHIYNDSCEYITKYDGKYTIVLDNTSAWYWNKDIKIQIKNNNKDIINFSNDKIIKYKTLFSDNIISRVDLSENIVDLSENINNNYFIIANVSSICKLHIYLQKGDILKWKINVCGKNSIDYKTIFQIDYFEILKKNMNKIRSLKFEKNNYLKDLNEAYSKLNKYDKIKCNNIIKKQDSLKATIKYTKKNNQHLRYYNATLLKQINELILKNKTPIYNNNIKKRIKKRINKFDKLFSKTVFKNYITKITLQKTSILKKKINKLKNKIKKTKENDNKLRYMLDTLKIKL